MTTYITGTAENDELYLPVSSPPDASPYIVDMLGGSDYITVYSGTNQIDMGAGDDWLSVNGGTNTVTLGSGRDLIDFHLTLGATRLHFIYDTPVTGIPQAAFTNSYDTWLQSLGHDTNGDGQVGVTFNGGGTLSTPVVEGFAGTFSDPRTLEVSAGKSGLHERHYYGAADAPGPTGPSGYHLLTNSGPQTITDFTFGGSSGDVLGFEGISRDDFLLNFTAVQSPTGTTLVAKDSGFSIDMPGLTGHSLLAIADNISVFQLGWS